MTGGGLGAGTTLRKKVKTLSLVINIVASAPRTFLQPFLISTPSEAHVSKRYFFQIERTDFYRVFIASYND